MGPAEGWVWAVVLVPGGAEAVWRERERDVERAELAPESAEREIMDESQAGLAETYDRPSCGGGVRRVNRSGHASFARR